MLPITRKGDFILRLTDANTQEQLNKVRYLYEEAFPKSEKKPFEMILKGRKKGTYEIMAIENEEGGFQGLAIIMRYGDLALLDYFAIHPMYRGTGVGSKALKALQKRYEGKKFLLEIESTIGAEATPEAAAGPGEAEEAAIRRRRKEFYLRGGMQPMDFLVNLFGVEMEIMTYDCSVTFEEYHSILEHSIPIAMAEKVKLARNLISPPQHF